MTVGVAADKHTFSCILHTVFIMLKNMMLPRFLGGGDRQYSQVTAFASLESLEKLANLAGEGQLKVISDSVWDMEDALKAYDIALGHRARGKVAVKVTKN